jgi:hypothetical protein
VQVRAGRRRRQPVGALAAHEHLGVGGDELVLAGRAVVRDAVEVRDDGRGVVEVVDLVEAVAGLERVGSAAALEQVVAAAAAELVRPRPADQRVGAVVALELGGTGQDLDLVVAVAELDLHAHPGRELARDGAGVLAAAVGAALEVVDIDGRVGEPHLTVADGDRQDARLARRRLVGQVRIATVDLGGVHGHGRGDGDCQCRDPDRTPQAQDHPRD